MVNENPGIQPTGPSFPEALRVWFKVALLSSGGPAGQIAVMRHLLVEENRWVDERRFLHALNFTMVLPGPEAQQLATYLGWLLHGTRGGLVAGTLFVLPGFLSILLLSILYVSYQDLAPVQALFYGLKPAVTAVVVAAVIHIGKKSLRNNTLLLLAAAAFVGIFFLDIPFPLIVLAAAGIGWLGGRLRLAAFLLPESAGDKPRLASIPSRGRSLRVCLVWLSLWFAPLVLLAITLGPDHLLVTQGLFFSKMAVVTFGGAYAVLAYVAQRAVEDYGWLAPGEMLDGLGMAETTPGPLIQVVQFVAFLGAYRLSGELLPLPAAIDCRLDSGDLGYLHPLLSLDLPRRALRRATGTQPLAQRCPDGGDRRRRRRHSQPRPLVLPQHSLRAARRDTDFRPAPAGSRLANS